jgi:uncharacterized cysteine cluster protein YcgN (CxxCxxCC family)
MKCGTCKYQKPEVFKDSSGHVVFVGLGCSKGHKKDFLCVGYERRKTFAGEGEE